MPPDAQQLPEAIFAYRLRRLRELRGLTQTDITVLLRERAGIVIDSSGLARAERGERNIRLGEALALAELLGATVDEMAAPEHAPAVEQIWTAEAEVREARRGVEVAEDAYTTAQVRLAQLRRRLPAIVDKPLSNEQGPSRG
jgi:transcriptional regulator with XRE-family HTH domain